jgi:multidrug efflux pump
VTVDIDRDKTALMGLSMSDIGNALSAMLGGGYVNYFSMEGRYLSRDGAGRPAVPAQS